MEIQKPHFLAKIYLYPKTANSDSDSNFLQFPESGILSFPAKIDNSINRPIFAIYSLPNQKIQYGEEFEAYCSVLFEEHWHSKIEIGLEFYVCNSSSNYLKATVVKMFSENWIE